MHWWLELFGNIIFSVDAFNLFFTESHSSGPAVTLSSPSSATPRVSYNIHVDASSKTVDLHTTNDCFLTRLQLSTH